jgi:carbohydrate binding protein with CBM6 domain/glucose/sorbosone dehydrogenase/purple acid phosphatase-like protein
MRKKLRQPAKRSGLVLWGVLLFSVALGARTAWAQYPSGPQVTKDGTVVVLQDYASLPLSSRTTGSYPPAIDFSYQLGRANFLRSEPGLAPQSLSRFFVNDQNRNLYILNKTDRSFTPYINFEEVFPNFVNPDYAEGLGTFIFDPDYAGNGKFYTLHVENPNKTGPAEPTNTSLPGLDLSGYTITQAVNPPEGTVVRHSVLVEWTDTNLTNSTFEGTAREILRVGFNTTIHPMADLLFNALAQPGGADYRNLYISVGDGSAGELYGATHTIPQRLDALQGKILRITPDTTLRPADDLSENGRYRIPTTGSDPNPFISLSLTGLRKEIYAYGFRNPHRMSWDPVSNKLIVNDIGLHSWEEVNLVTKGSNYGYAEREGMEQLFVTNDAKNGKTGSQTSPPTAFPDPDSLTVAGISTPVTPVYPVVAYSHRDGDAISSGFVYRGELMPQLRGKYIFGDITTARLFYADLADMITNDDDGIRTTRAAIHELQVVFDNPYDNPGLVTRRLFDIVANEYARKGGHAGSVLPGGAPVTGGKDPDGIAYGGGRADIRLALGGDGEIYVLSKSDGMIRALVAAGTVTLPTISTVTASGITAGAATITWTTDEAADSQLEYGPTTAYGSSTPLVPTLVTTHSQALSGLTAGTLYHYRVKSKDAVGNLAVSPDQTFRTFAAPGTQSPFKGAPFPAPGLIEAENFDLGGEGVAYHDAVAGNAGGLYRPREDVDIIAGAGNATGYVVNNIQTGEWLEYTIRVGKSGPYRIEAKVSSRFANSRFHIEIDGVDVTGPILAPNTGNWNSFRFVGKAGVNLTAGRHILRIHSEQEYFNLDAIRIRQN